MLYVLQCAWNVCIDGSGIFVILLTFHSNNWGHRTYPTRNGPNLTHRFIFLYFIFSFKCQVGDPQCSSVIVRERDWLQILTSHWLPLGDSLYTHYKILGLIVTKVRKAFSLSTLHCAVNPGQYEAHFEWKHFWELRIQFYVQPMLKCFSSVSPWVVTQVIYRHDSASFTSSQSPARRLKPGLLKLSKQSKQHKAIQNCAYIMRRNTERRTDIEKGLRLNIFFSFLCIVYNIHSVVVASVCCVNKLRSFGSMRSLIGSFVWIRTTCHLPIKNKPKVIKCIKCPLLWWSD